jgi:hypothetical protein
VIEAKEVKLGPHAREKKKPMMMRMTSKAHNLAGPLVCLALDLWLEWLGPLRGQSGHSSSEPAEQGTEHNRARLNVEMDCMGCLWVQCKWNDRVSDLARVGLASRRSRMSAFFL